jgi:hypothetical protein
MIPRPDIAGQCTGSRCQSWARYCAAAGWTDAGSFTGLGFSQQGLLHAATRRDGEDGEPDAYHRGIAPSVKLLHAVVARLAEIQTSAAQLFVRRWQADESSVFVRLWAAMPEAISCWNRHRRIISAIT